MSFRAKPVFRSVAATAWTGDTARQVKRRGGAEGLLVMQYLMTGPYTTMLGLYRLVVGYMGAETALGDAGAAKGLRACIEAGFCSYDEESEFVFVHEFAAWQIGPELTATDKRCKGVQKAYETLPDNPFLGAFFDRYAAAYHMTRRREPRTGENLPTDLFGPVPVRPSEAPSKPGAGTGPGTGAEPGAHFVGAAQATGEGSQDSTAPAAAAAATKAERGERLPKAWVLPMSWGQWALEEYPLWTPEKVRLEAAKFRDHWVGKTGKDATKQDWEATWRNWCRSELAHRDDPRPTTGGGAKGQAQRGAGAKALLGFSNAPEGAQEVIDG